jgi:hypothetical protein
MMAGDLSRPWQSLRWPRLILAAAVAPLPPIYISLAAFLLTHSNYNLAQVIRVQTPEPQIYLWGFSFLFALVYINLVSRFRGRVGMFECIILGGIAAMLIALTLFAGMELDVIPMPFIMFFPGVALSFARNWLMGGAILGLVLAPAGALSGWIFWRIGIAPAVPRSKTEVF